MAEFDLGNLQRSPEQLSSPFHEVSIATLVNPPDRKRLSAGIAYSIEINAGRTPPVSETSWQPREVSDTDGGVIYVPMNSCAEEKFRSAGHYLVTGNLNGCTALVAAYRDEQDTVHTFLGHYDWENVSRVGDDKKLKLSGLLSDFAGEHPVEVAVAYSRKHNDFPPDWAHYDPDYFPVAAIMDGCKELPDGSSALFIPYETKSIKEPTIGHTLHVARSPSDVIQFGWNGHKVTPGKGEKFDERRKIVAQVVATADEANYGLER